MSETHLRGPGRLFHHGGDDFRDVEAEVEDIVFVDHRDVESGEPQEVALARTRASVEVVVQEVPDSLAVLVELEACSVERNDREVLYQHFVPRLGSTEGSPCRRRFLRASRSRSRPCPAPSCRTLSRWSGCSVFFSYSIWLQLKLPEDEQRSEVLDGEELEVGGVFERSDLVSPLELGVQVSPDIELLSFSSTKYSIASVTCWVVLLPFRIRHRFGSSWSFGLYLSRNLLPLCVLAFRSSMPCISGFVCCESINI